MANNFTTTSITPLRMLAVILVALCSTMPLMGCGDQLQDALPQAPSEIPDGVSIAGVPVG